MRTDRGPGAGGGTRALQTLQLIVLAILATGSGCSKQDAAATGGFSMPPMPVETALVARTRVADHFETVGAMEASEMIDVVSEIDGAVRALPFHEGESIAEGALIAQLDDTQLAAEVARAEALNEQSQGAFRRIQAVVEQGAGAPQDLDDAQAVLKVAEANLALARARLAKTRITASFGGTLGARRVSPGAFLRAGEVITHLARLEEIRVHFSVPERHLAQIRRGAHVHVSTLAYPDLDLEGKIEVIEPVLDAGTRSARVLARVPNPDGQLRPGMSAKVTVELGERPTALVVPSEAVFVQNGQFLVYAIGADSTATPVPIVLGTRRSDTVEVVEGLSEGMRIVRAGHQKIFPQAKVIPITSQPQSSASEEGGEG